MIVGWVDLFSGRVIRDRDSTALAIFVVSIIIGCTVGDSKEVVSYGTGNCGRK